MSPLFGDSSRAGGSILTESWALVSTLLEVELEEEVEEVDGVVTEERGRLGIGLAADGAGFSGGQEVWREEGRLS